MTPDPDERLLGAWSTVAAPALVATIARSGVHWICLDAQHGEYDDRSLLDVCSRGIGVPLLVRVVSNDPARIGWALDVGASGVIVPTVENEDDAAKAATACRYPPDGTRSWGPLSTSYGDGDATDRPSRGVCCSVMIETAAGLDAVDRIARVDGVDELFVGPFDLALSLGTTVDDLLADRAETSPLSRVVSACRSTGRSPAAFAGTPAKAESLLDRGFRSVAVTTDTAALLSGVNRDLASVGMDGG